jgi:hypothetical protein
MKVRTPFTNIFTTQSVCVVNDVFVNHPPPYQNDLANCNSPFGWRYPKLSGEFLCYPWCQSISRLYCVK